MISVIVYGRNDAHGYNLQRRVALSLNCLSEVLTDSDDEIVFVDYNTPDELPTFVEALADTLTDRCLGLLRVIRVPAAIHEERFAAHTHLPVLEPVARNAGVRRANPSNRWLLMTNTDMMLLPRSNQSLSEICRVLPDGFYGLPRFELPEWLWERLPRTDPRRAMSEIERLGPGLRLDEPTVSNAWIRFDAPGDFQLILREDFLAIDGLDEAMLLGHHIDSNLSRRMFLHRGSIESLEESVAGYHCNHSRERTIYHRMRETQNDLGRFFLRVDQPELPAQRETWGLADAALEEVPTRERLGEGFAATLLAVIPSNAGPRIASDAARVPLDLTYDSGHILPFIADSLAVAPPETAIGYLGANPVLEGMLTTVVPRLGFTRPVEVAELDDTSSVDELIRTVDVFVVDLGLDSSLVDAPLPGVNGNKLPPLPERLELAFAALKRLVEVERARLERGEHPRRIMLVHSWTVFWDSWVLAHLDCSHTTAHSRIRRATVRPNPADDEQTRAALARERQVSRWAARGELERGALHVRPGQALELAELDDYRGFGEGWSYPDYEGTIWTQGPRAELALALDGVEEKDYLLALSLGGVCVGWEELLEVELLLNGEHVATRPFSRGDATGSWHVELPAPLPAEGRLELSFLIEEPRSPLAVGWSAEDDRPLGISIRALALASPDDEQTRAALARERQVSRWAARGELERGALHVRPGQALELAELDDYRGFGEGWSYPDYEGTIWTQGPRAELALALDGVEEKDYLLALSLGGVCVGWEELLEVELLLNGEHVATRPFSRGDATGSWHVELPAPLPAEGRLELSFLIEEPRSPLAVGWSAEDDRPLGISIRALALASPDDEQTRAALARERQVSRWAARGELERGALHVRPGQALELAELDDYRGFGEGWSYPDYEGTIWTQGPRAELALALDGVEEKDYLLALSLGGVCVGWEELLEVELLLNGEHVATRPFSRGDATGSWHVELPAPLPAEGRLELSFLIEEPRSPLAVGWSAEDDRPLGISIRALALREVDRTLRLGERIDFVKGSGADRLVGDGWSELEATGVWTVGESASLIFQPTPAKHVDLELVLVGTAFVTLDHPELELEVWAGNEMVARRVFRHGNASHELGVPLPAAARDETGRTVIVLHPRNPARPVDLGLSEDARRLGLRLHSVTLRNTGWRGMLQGTVRDRSASLLRRRPRS